jgi:diguanylate cyclase (GGDEF)-like protein/PAS domain S-box-containing protein
MALPMLLALAPICFLLYFLVDTHDRGIATASNEIIGVPVVAAVSQLRHAVIEESLGGDVAFSRAVAKAARDPVAQSVRIWPADRDLKFQAGEALIAIDAYLAGPTPSAAQVRDSMKLLGGVYAVAANASELILDPELDTYYLMDLIVNRFPALISTLWIMQNPDMDEVPAQASSAVRRAKTEGYRALLREQAEAVFTSYGFARAHQRDSGVGLAMDKGMLRFSAAVNWTETAGATGPELEIPELLEMLFASRGIEQVAADELVRLLEKRIAAFTQLRNQQIAFAAALAMLVMVVMLMWLNSSVLRPVRQITGEMRKLSEGDLEVRLDVGGRRDEIGQMVKAISVFRDTAVTRIRLEHEAAGAARVLAESTAALERAEKTALLGNWRYGIADQSLTWSKSMFDITGFDSAGGPPDLPAIASRVHQPDLLRLVASLETLRPEAPSAPFEMRLNHPDAGLRHVRLWIEVEFDSRRLPRSLFGTAQDISVLKEGQLALEARTQALAEAQAIGRIGNWSWKLNAPLIEWSSEIYSILGYDIDAFVPELEKVRALYAEDSLALLQEAQRKVLQHRGMEAVDVRAWRADGTKSDVTVITKADLDERGEILGFVGTIQDISDRKRAERDLEKLAFYDPLTGLANRALFQRSVRRYIDTAGMTGRKAALFLLDLDRFKEVNDSLGHAAGDDLLVVVADKLRRNLPQDAFLARLGGDEFAVIIPDADKTVAEAVGAHIIDIFAGTLHLMQGEVNIGTSIGCVIVPDDGTEADDLLRKADLALYKAKDEGRNRLQLFKPELSEIVQEKNRLARDLRRALETDSGLEVYFQPQFNPAAGTVTGYEALMRWKHPVRGFVPPAEFIPIAESAALICDIGIWVLRKGCRQMQAWIDAGHPPRDIAINVSATQLWQSDFEADVTRILAETGLPPHLLTLEVTESVFVKEGEGRIARILDNLRALGVTLALDDFGTGYSSLGYLNQLPFQKLKIDRVFVDGVDASAQRQRLLRGIIELGRGLGMTLIAEGAERPEEVTVLTGFGCDVIQGYVFARPVPADEAMAVSARIEADWRVRRAA